MSVTLATKDKEKMHQLRALNINDYSSWFYANSQIKSEEKLKFKNFEQQIELTQRLAENDLAYILYLFSQDNKILYGQVDITDISRDLSSNPNSNLNPNSSLNVNAHSTVSSGISSSANYEFFLFPEYKDLLLEEVAIKKTLEISYDILKIDNLEFNVPKAKKPIIKNIENLGAKKILEKTIHHYDCRLSDWVDAKTETWVLSSNKNLRTNIGPASRNHF